MTGRLWEAVSARPLTCTYVIESPHPYLPSQDSIEEVCFPGAAYIQVFFDSETCTEPFNDYVSIYKARSFPYPFPYPFLSALVPTLVPCFLPRLSCRLFLAPGSNTWVGANSMCHVMPWIVRTSAG